jgi:hypothetical protein
MARMARKLSDVAVVQAIAAEVKRSTRSMLTQLLQACGKGMPPWVRCTSLCGLPSLLLAGVM